VTAKTWLIQGFDGTNQIFETSLPYHLLSERQTDELLRRLVSKHLSQAEIIDASINSKNASLLEVRRDDTPQRLVLSCGENPHYSAIIQKP
jgi:hypothetical protein